MREDAIILLLEHNDDDAGIIERGLKRSDVSNSVLRFSDASSMQSFFEGTSDTGGIAAKKSYILLMDIDLPNGDAGEILSKIKSNTGLKMIPVIIFGSDDEASSIEDWHRRGCSIYLVKPEGSEGYSEAVSKVGAFLSSVEIPRISISVC
jgi:DNA-binding NarL/FixJ family response regulator